jgi:hypothetical protein
MLERPEEALVADRRVFHETHTDPEVAKALRVRHWYELAEWTSSGPGAALG